MTYKIMSYNLWCGSDTAERVARVLSVIDEAAPDILGVQEATPRWMQTLRAALSAYTAVGIGREGGDKGEYSAIFVKNERFTVLEEGTRWLTDTPTVYSAVKGSLCPRIYTYAKLTDKADGSMVYHVNTHLDHGPEEVRMVQAQHLYAFIETLDAPVTVTGDFNYEERTSDVYRYFTAGTLADAKHLAASAHAASTFHGYKNYDVIIDYCYCTRGAFDVHSYDVRNTPVDGAFASDHHPVIVTLERSAR